MNITLFNIFSWFWMFLVFCVELKAYTELMDLETHITLKTAFKLFFRKECFVFFICWVVGFMIICAVTGVFSNADSISWGTDSFKVLMESLLLGLYCNVVLPIGQGISMLDWTKY